MENTHFKRVVRAGFIGFWRNGIVSLASVFVMFITLFMIGSLIISSAFLGSILSDIESKVDVNVYFNPDALESDILILKDQLEVLPEVAEVEYVDRDEALARFLEKHKDNSLIIDSIEEIGENPLGAIFNIRAKEVSQYEGIAKFLDEQTDPGVTLSGDSIIDKVNYLDNKLVIERLSSIVSGARKLGIFVSLFLVVVSILVTFSTLQLAIYNSREEISVMRLVGAGNSFIRGPFIIEAIVYGVLSAVLATIVLFPVSIWVTSVTQGFFGGLNVFEYYKANAGQVFLIMLVSGVLIAMISSIIAIRKYLSK